MRCDGGAAMRWRFRALFAGLMATGMTWVYLSNYVNLGINPVTYWLQEPAMTLTIWVGALFLSLMLDALVGLYLRRLYIALADQGRGRALSPAEVNEIASRVIDLPHKSSIWLTVASVGLSLVHKGVEYGTALGALALNPTARTDMLLSLLREFLVVLVLALLLYTFSRRLLRVALARLELRQPPAGRRTPIGARILVLILVQAAFYTVFIVVSRDVPGPRLAVGLLMPLLLCGGVGIMVAQELSGDLSAISLRLRSLAAGAGPELFRRFAITDRDDVGEVVAAINTLQDRVEEEFHRLQSDLSAARSVQTAMLPRGWSPPAGWDLAVRLIPAEHVGGDFYDMIDLGEGRFAIAVGDAVGKGLSAALMMASVVSLIRSQATLQVHPKEVLRAVNRLLYGSVPQGCFVTVAYAVVETRHNLMTVASAGHWAPVVAGAEIGVLPGLPLGIDLDVEYRELTCPLEPGAPVLFYSDGLIEHVGALRGNDMAEALCTPNLTASARIEAVFRAAGVTAEASHSPVDDIMGLIVVPPAVRSWVFPSEHGSELMAAREAAAVVRQWGMAERADSVATAVGEACLNAIIHGNRLQPERTVTMRAIYGAESLDIVVADEGQPFHLPANPPNLHQQIEGDGPIGGWGLHLIRQMADELRVEPLETGKQVRMRFLTGGGTCV